MNLVPAILLLGALVIGAARGCPPRWRALAPLLVFSELLLWNCRYVAEFRSAEWVPYSGTLDDLRRPVEFSTSISRWSTGGGLYSLRPTYSGYDPLVLSSTYRLLSSPAVERVYTRGVDWHFAQGNRRFDQIVKRRAWLARHYVPGPLPDKAALFPAATTVFLPSAIPAHVPRVAPDDLRAGAIADPAAPVAIAQGDLVPSVGSDNAPAHTAKFVVRLPERALPHAHAALQLRYRSSGASAMDLSVLDIAARQLFYLQTVSIQATGPEGAWLEWPLPDGGPFEVKIAVPQQEAGAEFSLLEGQVVSDLADEGDRITITDAGANSTEFHLRDLPDYRLLLFAEARYPGWRAFLDGAPAPILDANDALMAVEVPPGSHDVRFEFRSPRLYAAMGVSIAAWLGASVGIVLLGRARHHVS